MANNRGMRGMGRIVKPLKDRVDNMVARAIVRLIADGTKLQSLQIEVQKGEVREDCERFQQYGFSSVPLAGAEAVVVFVGGGRDHPLVTNVDDRRYRPTNLQPGDAIVYNNNGGYVHVKADGTIKIKTNTRVDVEAPLVRMTGNLEVQGDITDRYTTNTRTVGNMRTIYNTHDHPETNTGNTLDPNQTM